MTAMPEDTQRLDKWLWCARIFKTRALAAKVISGKGVRITRNGRTDRTGKPGFSVRPGDTVTFTKEKSIRILEITGLAERRGPAAEAQKLYIDHSDILSQTTPPTEQRTFMLDKLFASFRPSEDVVEDENANLKNAVAALLVEAARQVEMAVIEHIADYPEVRDSILHRLHAVYGLQQSRGEEWTHVGATEGSSSPSAA